MIRNSDYKLRISLILVIVLVAGVGRAQVVLPPGFTRSGSQVPKPAPAKEQPPAAKPEAQPAKPGQPPANTPAAAQQPPATTDTPPQIAPSSPAGALNLQNASLTEVIDILARQLKINYILDPRVRGGVTINTYGETKSMDNRALLDMILRINGAAMIQVGEIFRIVPLSEVQRLPLPPEVNGKPLPEDDRTMLNLLFLKYATVDELIKLLDQFQGENSKMWSYSAANLLIIQDSRRNMKRLMDLVALFDDPAFANQRVRLFEVQNGRPSELARELEGILKGISLSEKSTPVKLLPVDRINTLIAVAPNPGVFADVERWLKKLDIAVESSAGAMNNYVYRVKYGFAPTLAMAIMGLYSNNPAYAMQMMMASYMMGQANMGMGGGTSGMGGMGGMGMGMGMGMGGMGMGGMYGGMGGMYGGGMYGGGMYGGGMGQGLTGYTSPAPSLPTTPTVGTAAAAAANATAGIGGTPDLTGTYLGTGQGAAFFGSRSPRIIPNPFDNTLLIQGTRQEYESIVKLLRDIDVAPRQVLIEAKIYEVNLTGALASGVTASLRQRGADGSTATRQFLANLADGLVTMSAGTLVGQTRELMAFLSLQEVAAQARVISAPSVIATDSVPASINVGTEVPTLTAQAVTGAQQGGTSLFANSIQNRQTGVTLQISARVNPSGIVTMIIGQEVSAPTPPPAGADVGIQSPAFSRRSVQTQVTVQDGDTIAIGGIINESNGISSAGIPLLHRIPFVGAVFGSRSYNKERTELIIFLTPRVIFDQNDILDATEELKSNLRRLSKHIRE